MITPFSNDIGLKGYEADPFLPSKFVVGNNQIAIASVLVPLWLSRFISPRAIPEVRLETYRVNKIEVGQWKHDRFDATANVSVKPLKRSTQQWQLEGGRKSGGWVKGISLRYEIVRRGEDYRIGGVAAARDSA